MRLNTNNSYRNLILYGLAFFATFSYGADREKLIRAAILASGFVPAEEMYDDRDANIGSVGKIFFESKHLSLNGEISCSTCHISTKGSSDGIPNAAGVRGRGESVDRLRSGAKIIPRNTLALWGVGAKSHKTFFWDGKLVDQDNGIISQFGTRPPSRDPLVTAVHLPAVEIRETLEEDAFISANKNESVEGVQVVYSAILKNLQKTEKEGIEELARALAIKPQDVSFLHISRAIAAFIRSEFRVRETKVERFVTKKSPLEQEELLGAEIFYGKGGCAVCHRGALFTDQKFYSVPIPPIGFGKNGFGADYGRFNASFDPSDLYKFRTPILYNVSKTAPYGHSGSMRTLKEAIVSHVDPLSLVNLENLDSFGRHEYSKILASSDLVGKVQFVNDAEVEALIAFLDALSF